MRYGINPSISSLAFIIVCLTIFFALVHEVRTRRAQLAIANGAPVGAVKGGFQVPKFFAGNPAAVVFAIFVAGAVATLAFSQIYDPEPAKAVLLKQKRADQQDRIKALQQRMREKRLQKQFKGPDIFGSGSSKIPRAPSKTPFGGVFAPSNLDEAAPKAKTKTPESPGKGTFGDVFNPGSLDTTTEEGEKTE